MRSPSVEKQARKALRRLTFYRLLGELIALPQVICKAVISILMSFGRWFNRIELAIFALEQDAARRYILLTGLDLGTATGEPGRYAALNAENAEAIQEAFMREAMSDEP